MARTGMSATLERNRSLSSGIKDDSRMARKDGSMKWPALIYVSVFLWTYAPDFTSRVSTEHIAEP